MRTARIFAATIKAAGTSWVPQNLIRHFYSRIFQRHWHLEQTIILALGCGVYGNFMPTEEDRIEDAPKGINKKTPPPSTLVAEVRKHGYAGTLESLRPRSKLSTQTLFFRNGLSFLAIIRSRAISD